MTAPSIGALRHRLDREALRLKTSTSSYDRAAGQALDEFLSGASEPVLARIAAIIRGEIE